MVQNISFCCQVPILHFSVDFAQGNTESTIRVHYTMKSTLRGILSPNYVVPNAGLVTILIHTSGPLEGRICPRLRKP